MLIAIPAIGSVIEDSRKGTFASSAQLFASGANTYVLTLPGGNPTADTSITTIIKEAKSNSLGTDIGTKTTYLIKISDIKMERGNSKQSAFSAAYNESKSFVAIVKDGENWKYYIQLVDNNNNGLPLTESTAIDSKKVQAPISASTTIYTWSNIIK